MLLYYRIRFQTKRLLKRVLNDDPCVHIGVSCAYSGKSVYRNSFLSVQTTTLSIHEFYKLISVAIWKERCGMLYPTLKRTSHTRRRKKDTYKHTTTHHTIHLYFIDTFIQQVRRLPDIKEGYKYTHKHTSFRETGQSILIHFADIKSLKTHKFHPSRPLQHISKNRNKIELHTVNRE